jgi:Hint module
MGAAHKAAYLSVLLLAAVASAAVPPQPRAAVVSDIDGSYTAKFKLSPACPSSVNITRTTGRDGGTGKTPVASIVEDGVVCSGGTMLTVSEAVAQNTSNYDAVGLGKNGQNLAARIAKNGPANSTIFNGLDTAETLVGFDTQQRVCGKNSYDMNTFWFFIKESAGQSILIATGNKSTTTVIPKGFKGLFLATTDSRLCIYTSPVTADQGSGASPSAEPDASGLPDASPDDGGSASTSGGKTGNSTDRKSSCFPASASVQMADGRTVPISSLEVGDSVRTGPHSYSDVFMFTHRAASSVNTFVKLTTAAGPAITLTPGHYVYVVSGAASRLVAAADVSVGDSLLLSDDSVPSPVVSRQQVSDTGLYNPQTLDGSIVVDGVVASAYTTAVHPSFAHSALAPVRWLYEALPFAAPRWYIGSMFANGSPTAAALLPSGPPVMVVTA